MSTTSPYPWAAGFYPGDRPQIVTSRFHAMISALVERTPLLVVGWSHKYGEVLAQFGLVDAAMLRANRTPKPAVA